ncbi:MAG: hypothetical protein F6K00_02415 [Leptolyngbya sp. SIOISBB]|nr:hypothetical protein [Leptolyngbya sp. SIOISBB]
MNPGDLFPDGFGEDSQPGTADFGPPVPTKNDDLGVPFFEISDLNLDDLSQSGQIPDPRRPGFTKAGGSLTKHGAGRRDGNTKFPNATGNPDNINQIAQQELDNILRDPNTDFEQGYRDRFGETIEANSPDGRGAVFDKDGNFLFFKE